MNLILSNVTQSRILSQIKISFYIQVLHRIDICLYATCVSNESINLLAVSAQQDLAAGI
ncbi:hypothetical protein [Pedobacter mucosus]|uniref:hypothetical protein n=1 Tax=Pedobacter mucosus TaxID=2895286 RepID=UPI001EE45DB5|nr:hypothetical protein [Pedobacter mucosus]UKT64877.1 hypothetical protein LOK61_03680 [Pedobacter mucosus]